mmetsp:Transcript_24734/g.67283  ORF Transcript_24734/g.67283 Transcript_24734/m.67283 type:complete len:653 (-) Transcript_24734:358-2316(-)
MHPRNIYATHTPDFGELAEAYPALRPYCRSAPPQSKHTVTLNWSQPRAFVELARALLARDFGVRWDLPEGHLCPTVPSRLNYLLAIEDLLLGQAGGPAMDGTCTGQPPSRRRIRGLDIGTGASAIYPLLGRAALGWTFVASEVDDEAAQAAEGNVAANGWASDIEVRRAEGGRDGLLRGAVRPGERYDFCMCNPPFYSSETEAVARANPHTAPAPGQRSSGTPSELVCAGGEEGFLARLVRESADFAEQVVWFTTLLGRKASLEPLAARIRSLSSPAAPCPGPVPPEKTVPGGKGGGVEADVHGESALRPRVACIRWTELTQGQQSRWVLAWTFEAAACERAPASATVQAGEWATPQKRALENELQLQQHPHQQHQLQQHPPQQHQHQQTILWRDLGLGAAKPIGRKRMAPRHYPSAPPPACTAAHAPCTPHLGLCHQPRACPGAGPPQLSGGLCHFEVGVEIAAATEVVARVRASLESMPGVACAATGATDAAAAPRGPPPQAAPPAPGPAAGPGPGIAQRAPPSAALASARHVCTHLDELWRCGEPGPRALARTGEDASSCVRVVVDSWETPCGLEERVAEHLVEGEDQGAGIEATIPVTHVRVLPVESALDTTQSAAAEAGARTTREHLCLRLRGDVERTNRKWRRRLS